MSETLQFRSCNLKGQKPVSRGLLLLQDDNVSWAYAIFCIIKNTKVYTIVVQCKENAAILLRTGTIPYKCVSDNCMLKTPMIFPPNKLRLIIFYFSFQQKVFHC